MSRLRADAAGASRTCPHCRAVILASAAACPACRGHLQYAAPVGPAAARSTPLQVEATLQRAPGEAPVEYTMLLSIRDERGVELSRHVVGVGALRANQQRHFRLTVEAAEVDSGGR